MPHANIRRGETALVIQKTTDHLTPMFRQYRAVKERYPGVIVLFRLGDFYEMFGEDATLVARELNLTLTSREIGKGHRVPMCGVPHHAVERYLARLIGRGFKCALADQMEDARLAKGLVRREVTRVVSAGTIVEDNLLAARANNFLAAVTQIGDRLGLALADVSTGDFLVTELNGQLAHEQLRDELTRWQPAEVLAPPEASDDGSSICNLHLAIRNSQCRPTSFEFDPFSTRSPQEKLCEQFGVHSLRGFGLEPGTMPAAVAAAANVLDYLRRTQLAALAHLKSLRVYSTDQYVALDPATRRNLELTHSLRDGSTHGTLLSVIDQTETAMGGRLLRRWLLQPLLSVDEIVARHDAVQRFFDDAILRGDGRELLRNVSDLERLTSRAATGTANARDLLALLRSLDCVPQLRELLLRARPDALNDLDPKPTSPPAIESTRFDDLPELRELLARALAEDPPAQVNEGGLIRAGYSAELDDLRLGARDGKQWIVQLEATERERTGIRSLKVGFNHVFGYFIEVTKPNLHLVPQEYHRKQTTANAERFLTPELKEVEARVLGAEERAALLEHQLFVALREAVAHEASRLLATAQALAQLDVFSAFAELAARHRYVRPEMNDGGTIELEDGRHPVVEQTQTDAFVPNDVQLDGSEAQVLILTGPNMAGKSTYLRQVALITLLAQIGSFVPARRARLGVVDRIFTRVGAQDDLATGQSTFMVEMTETANILNNATANSLVILDEIGRGTSTFDGLSLAWAVAEALHERGCKTLFATHYHHLNELETLLPRIRNYRIAVKEDGERIIFLRRIVRGGADRSYGIQVARLAGIPAGVIERARQVLWTLEQEQRLDVAPRADTLAAIVKPVQLSLFDGRHPVIEALRTLDLEAMTPLELNRLHELKEQAR